ncbi:armadillo-type protein [Xylaria nigripes]|nr:armadillo-type protein [Xylaria nigripes]
MSYDPPTAGNFRPERLTPDFDLTTRSQAGRRGNRYDTRLGAQGYGNAGQGYNNQPMYGGYSYSQGHYDPSAITSGGSQNSIGAGVYSNYQQTPVGTTLSPLASEFTSISGAGPWKSEPSPTEGQTYLPTTEPLNYRRLLDRNVNCNWKYIVDKIVCSNDQQASIFLQQKLKVGTPDQKYEIVEAIVAQAYPLMVNRFGNFLVQRCFEHGTPEQVIKIAEAIRGCTLTLSMDPFGCHVVQKAFDSVPEDYKAIMVHELLRRIPETVIHRYACHVWQKLFELRWTESPPQIMKYVNEALRGMWHEVALGETGSLVVQNIFENCLEEDKRPCIEEVLNNIDIVAHGQFGNWCIQHICEHGAPADRSRAIDHVIRYAAEYSMDQYASKVVEKCLKIGGAEFLARYLDRVCEGRIDRPRIPLIDIASDQYGNYLIQWILQHANPQHKEIVAAHIRKHMVSLRGSKFGSRVGMLCTNPAVATRPGPGVGPGVGRMPAGPRYGGRAYQ